MKNKELLQNNWKLIQAKVVVPLWKRKFKSMYEGAKMDYDDFESLAGIELTKAIHAFDSEKSNIFTFSTNVITKKAMTELRNCTQRDVRKTLHVSDSVDSLDGHMIENIPNKYRDNDEALSEKMLKYLNRLSKLQRKVLLLQSEGFDNESIKTALKIDEKTFLEALQGIKAYRNISILF